MANSADESLLIVVVAGEPSGDNLAAQLIEVLRERLPRARFAGCAGPKMIAAGCEPWFRAEELAVIGIFEVLPELPRLLRIRRQLIERVKRERPAVYIGVDFKEFNLSVAKQLKRAGLRTVQYVSPQVWAWRQGRVHKISQAVDLMLCLLPFEKPFYDAHAVDARYVGHPLADRIPLESDRAGARRELGLDANRPCVALLPGSRRSEVSRLSPDFAATVAWLSARRPELQFVAAMATDEAWQLFAAELTRLNVSDKVVLREGKAQAVMAASDVVLLASGTATLEAALIKRPMVVVYRLGWLTSFLLQRLKMMKAPFFSHPNLLSGKKLVPEFFNDEVTAEILGPAVLEQMERPDRAALLEEFHKIHAVLRRDASRQAAEAVLERLPT